MKYVLKFEEGPKGRFVVQIQDRAEGEELTETQAMIVLLNQIYGRIKEISESVSRFDGR